MTKIIYYLAIVALLVTIIGIGWAMWINFMQGALAMVLGWISAWLLLEIGVIIEIYHK